MATAITRKRAGPTQSEMQRAKVRSQRVGPKKRERALLSEKAAGEERGRREESAERYAVVKVRRTAVRDRKMVETRLKDAAMKVPGE